MAGDKLQLHTKLYAWCQPVRPRLRMAAVCLHGGTIAQSLRQSPNASTVRLQVLPMELHQ